MFSLFMQRKLKKKKTQTTISNRFQANISNKIFLQHALASNCRASGAARSKIMHEKRAGRGVVIRSE